jgi:CubicO group peptidase (beta-lactamase class C family)
MCSFGADGGIVSTAEESMIFIKAFFNGQLFPKEYINEMKIWNNIFFPLQYGVGLARFKLPRIFSAFKSYPELIGHSGLSGAFAFYCPAKEIYFTGTVNQISNPSISYKLMIKLLSAL